MKKDGLSPSTSSFSSFGSNDFDMNKMDVSFFS